MATKKIQLTPNPARVNGDLTVVCQSTRGHGLIQKARGGLIRRLKFTPGSVLTVTPRELATIKPAELSLLLIDGEEPPPLRELLKHSAAAGQQAAAEEEDDEPAEGKVAGETPSEEPAGRGGRRRR